ncbi:Chitin deacetylase [Mycena venus]|uniref:Chitin deacetylase n=1 Tax=Mycena venus TaxID=2733690 RepID=A0A8H6X811_9AGAR|nr:Chitin deacetylase [Mycena venus]
MLIRVTASTILLAALSASARPLNDSTLATVYDKCVVNNTIALTFDDGPWIYMNEISDLFTDHQAKATFFISTDALSPLSPLSTENNDMHFADGDNYDCIYDDKVVQRLRYTYKAGHQICSHTWSHPDLNTLDAAQIEEEITKQDPYGNYNDLVRQVAKNLDKDLVTWDFDSGDSVGKSWQQSEKLYTTKINKHPQNASSSKP